MFRFKQFDVEDAHSAMKVGTDGVLVGTMSRLCHSKGRILDIGCGCGLISLILAQRYPLAQIDGIDIHKGSIKDALNNVASSPFHKQIKIYHSSLQDWQSPHQYDLIVSNPPFFTETHQAGTVDRTMARHAQSLPPPELFGYAQKHLTPNGAIELIYPISMQKNYETAAQKHSLYQEHSVHIKGTTQSPPKRIFSSWRKDEPCQVSHTLMSIEKSRHCYTPEYIELTRDFYLNL